MSGCATTLLCMYEESVPSILSTNVLFAVGGVDKKRPLMRRIGRTTRRVLCRTVGLFAVDQGEREKITTGEARPEGSLQMTLKHNYSYHYYYSTLLLASDN